VVESAALEDAGPPGGYQDARLRKVVQSTEWSIFGPQDYVLTARRGDIGAPDAELVGEASVEA
jgi:hypothetical protein